MSAFMYVCISTHGLCCHAYMYVIAASLSEPHTNGTAVRESYIYNIIMVGPLEI